MTKISWVISPLVSITSTEDLRGVKVCNRVKTEKKPVVTFSLYLSLSPSHKHTHFVLLSVWFHSDILMLSPSLATNQKAFDMPAWDTDWRRRQHFNVASLSLLLAVQEQSGAGGVFMPPLAASLRRCHRSSYWTFAEAGADARVKTK